MIFEIDRDSLLEGMSKIVSITERRSPLPILTHALMDVRDSMLSITATDLEVGIKVSYKCLDSTDGLATIPARKFLEIVKELASGSVRVELQDRFRVKITADRSSFDLAGMDPADFPAWSNIEGIEAYEISCEKLVHMLEKTLFASSNDDSRFNLNGVLIEKIENKTRFVATDGHRLALIDEEIDIPLISKVIVPKKGLIELRRLLEGQREKAFLGFEKKNLFVKTGKGMMTIRLIEGDYPDYSRVIPTDQGKMILAKRNPLLQSLKRMAILTSDRNKGVNINIKSDQMEFSVNHPDLGAANDVLEVDYKGEEEINLIVNVVYIMEAIINVETENISIEYYKEGAPIKFLSGPEVNCFSIVMPMRK
ncbi:MAG: DNA polymerase III subunit beta [Deltaproteobacteria bacterium]|nr:DNA polymerase III subunit beta [Deltaproteobacteria bacterium]